MKFNIQIISLIFCFKIVISSGRKMKSRSLIFPVTAPTRIQFIGGIGIPVEDLVYESITSGYVLKAEYFLPSKAEQLRPNYLKPQLIHRRSANKIQYDHKNLNFTNKNVSISENLLMYNENHTSQSVNYKNQYKNGSKYRWIIYKSIEILLDRANQPGRKCLLRSICEHAALPLNYESGLLAEILRIILTPSTSNDNDDNDDSIDNKIYLQAELMGRKGVENCEQSFKECTASPMNKITTIIGVTD